MICSVCDVRPGTAVSGVFENLNTEHGVCSDCLGIINAWIAYRQRRPDKQLEHDYLFRWALTIIAMAKDGLGLKVPSADGIVELNSLMEFFLYRGDPLVPDSEAKS